MFLSTHCHVLLALWDGKGSDRIDGTAQVVKYRQHGVMPGYTQDGPANRLMLADDESDLVYHIVVSRRRTATRSTGSARVLVVYQQSTHAKKCVPAGSLPHRF